jgi:23S rRNA pseudouridine1911/1915/1917 synthase
LIRDGHILVDGQPAKPSHRPQHGQTIQVHWPDVKPAEAQPEEIPLTILFEDEELLVLNKPAGMVVHPGVGHDDHTLVNALLHHCAGKLSGIGGVARPGIVHRLDRDTSGCMVVAKTDVTHQALQAQFAGRTLEKIYHAIVCGEVPKLSGDIRASIARHPTHRKRMAAAVGEGREAWTSYRVVERLKASTLVEVTLRTGRTHQIRVHFQHLGFPVAGDDVYGKRQCAQLKQATGYEAQRQMLHASRLTFTHPLTKERLVFEAPRPEDFEIALAALGLA